VQVQATFKRVGTIGGFRDRFVSGMLERGHDADFAARCFARIEGFGSYGFPESHAASFSRLVYISAWLKCHHPAVFTCALLNSQPMGFYAPAQLVYDAREHGVELQPVSVNHSLWDCTLEPQADGALALRLGFRQIKGLREQDAAWIVAARGNGYLLGTPPHQGIISRQRNQSGDRAGEERGSDQRFQSFDLPPHGRLRQSEAGRLRPKGCWSGSGGNRAFMALPKPTSLSEGFCVHRPG
jgi:hypothetical protein